LIFIKTELISDLLVDWYFWENQSQICEITQPRNSQCKNAAAPESPSRVALSKFSSRVSSAVNFERPYPMILQEYVENQLP